MMGYQSPFFNPYGFMQQGQMPQPQQPAQQIVKVSGENGARAYQMGANSSALLLDESGLLVWLCVSDGAGYKTVTAYDITPHKDAPAPDYGSLENRIQAVEKKIEEVIANGNTKRTAPAGKKQSEDAAD